MWLNPMAVIALVYGATPDGDDREEDEANVFVPSALVVARGRCQVDRLGEDARDVKLR